MADAPAPAAPPAPPIAPPAAPAAPAAPAVPPTPTDGLFAGGKIQGPVALEKAAREITATLIERGVPLPPLPDGALFGEGNRFKDVKELDGYYLSSEKTLGRLQPVPAAAPAAPAPGAIPPVAAPALKPGELPGIPDAPAAPAPGEDDLDFSEVLVKAGLKEEDVGKQFAEKGACTEEQYAALKKVGWNRKLADRIIRNEIVVRQTVVQGVVAELDEIAGSADSRNAYLTWAGQHYKGDDLAAIKTGMAKTGTAVATMKQIIFDHGRTTGNDKSRPLAAPGAPPPPASGAPYTDPKEYQAALNKGNNRTPEEDARFRATNPNVVLKL